MPKLSDWFGVSPRGWTIGAAVLISITGFMWARRRFKEYGENTTAYSQFDSERDRQIVFWQRWAALILFTVVIPYIAALFLVIL